MYDENRKQRIARIIELAIPTEFFDMLEDLSSYYGSQEKAVLEAIKAHHKDQFGTLDDFKVEFTPVTRRTVSQISTMNTPVTDGKLSKIFENGEKINQRTQDQIEEVDKILTNFNEKLNDLAALKELRDEISSMKAMIQNMGAIGTINTGVRRASADLSSLEVSVVEAEEGTFAPPERPLLESVLDSILLFDDEELDTIVEEEKIAEEKKKK
ncbi:MAG: hypothetical protein ACXABK_00740 [Candidatus Heimdallarchaeaceae archaeon]